MKVCLFILAAFLALSLVAGDEPSFQRQKRLYPTRCYPGSHCYPDQEELALFKETITGQVLVPTDAQYLTFVSMTNERWTRHPGIVVVALTVEDVQKTVLFCRKYYLNLVTSASGLDYQGRGSYDGSLKLDLSQLKGISTTNLQDFSTAGTVTASAGNTWQEVYTQVEGSGRVVVGGTNSLDSVDFYTVSGGLGTLSRSLGLVADNLVSARVVLADGRLGFAQDGYVTLTDSEGNVVVQEDFEAMPFLRGGGLTWGIPVSFTFRLYFPPGIYAGLSASYRIVDNGVVVGAPSLRFLINQVTSLPVQWGGYIALDGSVSPTQPNDKGEINLSLFSYGFHNYTLIGTRIYNIQNYFPTNRLSLNPTPPSSYSAYRSSAQETNEHFVSQKNSYVMNTLISQDTLTNRLDEFVDFMMTVVNSPTVDSNYKCVGRLAGGKVRTPNSNTFVSQNMRDAVFSWTCALTWSEGIIREDFYLREALEFQKKLRSFGNGGVDPYYASEDLEDWKTALYGNKYKTLLESKKSWDVDNYLWAHNAVASDFELQCNNVRCPHRH